MSKKLLLADDSITIQKVIQITFAHEDYELTITDNGDAALLKAQAIKPDLVMADVYMPGKNGYELATAIKQDPSLQHVPVLLLAGSFEPFDEDKARSCRADAWIEKPFESQSLIDKVAELLSRAPVAPQLESAAAGPVVRAAAAFEAAPLAAFDEPSALEPDVAAAEEDPFSDISFEDETPPAQPEAVAVADAVDWGDVVLDEPALTLAPAAFSEQDAAGAGEDYRLAAESPGSAESFREREKTPLAATDFGTFDMDEEEIIPLDEDDILGAEDLEPVMEEQTLAPWSRAAADEEDLFAAPLEEEVETPAFVTEPAAFEPAAFEPAAFDEPAVYAEPPAFEEPAGEQPATIFTAPASVAAADVGADAEARAAALSEAELERIIEKVVAKVVTQLAATVLERVAWEVVPDLAETLIRAEIGKIKDAAA